MTNTATHTLKFFALADDTTDVSEDFATYAEAEAELASFVRGEDYGMKEHAEGGWIIFDADEEKYAALITS